MRASTWGSFTAHEDSRRFGYLSDPGGIGRGGHEPPRVADHEPNVIVDEHQGRVPGDLAALRRLPGVGPYTARAVAALTFGQPVGAVDTNIRRVLGRAAGGVEGLEPKALQVLADELVPVEGPGRWTHALMDIGASLCRPRNPRCVVCPLKEWCRFAAVPPEPAPRSGRVARGAASSAPFRATPRWLRGRILDRLRDAGPGDWVTFDDPMGDHDTDTTIAALARLAREGLVELRGGSGHEARLPEA